MQPRGVLTGQPDLGTGLSMVWGEFHRKFRDGSGGPQTQHEKIEAHTARDLPCAALKSLYITLVTAGESNYCHSLRCH